jgi:DNA-directed RNA polymerase specialized sigma24 family protein
MVCAPSEDPDRVLVDRARSGDSVAYTNLWNQYWPALCRFFARQISCREEAEDLASETLVAAFTNLSDFRGQTTETPSRAESGLPSSSASARCTFRTYLYVIARNNLRQWIRRKKARPICPLTDLASNDEENADHLERFMVDTESDPLVTLLREADQREVWLALEDVCSRSLEQFKALVYFYGCNASHKEAADALYLASTRSETFNTRLQEGRRTLLRFYQRLNPPPNAPC